MQPLLPQRRLWRSLIKPFFSGAFASCVKRGQFLQMVHPSEVRIEWVFFDRKPNLAFDSYKGLIRSRQ
jgi:hypothetical protein